MTMATYSKNRLTNISSRTRKQIKNLLFLQAKHDVPSDTKPSADKIGLCNRNNNSYDILDAVGLKRVNVKYEAFIKAENIAVNNNDKKLRNRNAPRDDNDNTARYVNEAKLHKCIKCNVTFKCLRDYTQHCKQNHICSKILYCKICSKTFINSKLFLNHKKRHSGAKPYCCGRCNKTFPSLQSLTAHIRRHLGKLPYTCKICKMGFDVYSELVNHQSVHLLRKTEFVKPKLYQCNNCLKEFRKFSDLERHRRVHTGEKPYACSICKNRFQQAHNLTKHMIIHTKEKLFKCEICSKKFGRSDILTRHMITHAVDKPFPCGFCEKSFGRQSQYADHVKKYHSKII